MLVVHPSSRCDVCLDEYSWTTPAHTPHAIACGHIFCLICLQALSHPTSCPLCRKLFQPDRVKKLHVDRATDETPPVESQDVILLQRIALASGERTPEPDVILVIDQATRWLNAQDSPDNATSGCNIPPSERNRPLRAAIAALQNYTALKDKCARQRVTLENQTQQLLDFERRTEEDQATAHRVEENLLAQVQEFATKLEDKETELSALRLEMSRFRNISNPLPPPPEPLPLDRFPPFARPSVPGAASSNTNNADTISISSKPSNRYANTFHVEDGFRPLTASEQETLARHEAQIREIVDAPARPRHSPRQAPVPPPPNNTYNPQGVLTRYNSDAEHNSNAHRAGIIPGAPPRQRVVPDLPRYGSEAAGRTGHQAHDNDRRSESAGEPSRNALVHRSQDRERERRDVPPSNATTASRRLSILGSDTSSVVVPPSAPAPVPVPASHPPRRDPVQTRAPDHPASRASSSDGPAPSEQGVGGLGLIGVPQPLAITDSAHNETSDAAPSRPPLRRGTATLPILEPRPLNQRTSDLSSLGIPNQLRRVSETDANRILEGSMLLGPVIPRADSASSWGSVHTGDVLRGNERGSLSDLGLIGFPDPGSTGNDTPSADSQSLSSLPSDDDSDEDGNDHNTPVMRERHLQPSSTSISSLGMMIVSSLPDNSAADRRRYPPPVIPPPSDSAARDQRQRARHISGSSDPTDQSQLPGHANSMDDLQRHLRSTAPSISHSTSSHSASSYNTAHSAPSHNTSHSTSSYPTSHSASSHSSSHAPSHPPSHSSSQSHAAPPPPRQSLEAAVPAHRQQPIEHRSSDRNRTRGRSSSNATAQLLPAPAANYQRPSHAPEGAYIYPGSVPSWYDPYRTLARGEPSSVHIIPATTAPVPRAVDPRIRAPAPMASYLIIFRILHI